MILQWAHLGAPFLNHGLRYLAAVTIACLSVACNQGVCLFTHVYLDIRKTGLELPVWKVIVNGLISVQNCCRNLQLSGSLGEKLQIAWCLRISGMFKLLSY